MTSIADIRSQSEAQAAFTWEKLWALFDGNAERMNLTHECIDRHAGKGTAVSIKFADGRLEHHDFAKLSELTGRFANWLERRGVAKGERVAIMLEPSLGFYVGMFGAVKRGAIGVPLFTLFGPEGLALRINDCKPRVILVDGEPTAMATQFPDTQVVRVDEDFWAALAAESPAYASDTKASDLAIFQYTSGTTREMPEAVKHTHRGVVTLMIVVPTRPTEAMPPTPLTSVTFDSRSVSRNRRSATCGSRRSSGVVAAALYARALRWKNWSA